MEEAAVIAADYLSTLDNLPSEAAHLLAEIRDRENKYQEIQAHIQTKSASYIRHALSGAPLSVKDMQNSQKVTIEYQRMHQLAEEKVALAQRIVDLLSKASGRLDVDLGRVLVASGEAPPPESLFGAPLGGRSTLDKLNESLRSVLGPEISPPHSVPSSVKRRRLNPGNSHAASPSPSVPASRTRMRHSHSPAVFRRGTSTVELEVDEDAEGEEEGEVAENGDQEDNDNELYCFCQKESYGEMIACDNSNCQYEWFHTSCVNLSDPLPENWYCAECAPHAERAHERGGERRKGRRK